jgi:hypothetical protein
MSESQEPAAFTGLPVVDGLAGIVARRVGRLIRSSKPALSSTTLPELEVSVTRKTKAAVCRSEWDGFAQRCGASFRCSYDALAVWQRSGGVLFRLRLVEIFQGPERRKIAQCGVAVRMRHRAIIDGLQILPAEELLWGAAMRAVLAELGAGRYSYGSQWSIEPPRQGALAALPGVTIDRALPVTVQVVDFRHWDTWDSYARQMSANARRNAQRALRTHPDLAIGVHTGWATLRDMPGILRLHRGTTRRKGIGTSTIRMLVRLLVRTFSLHRHAVSALISLPSQGCLAAFSGVEFGQNTYYLTGGSRPDNGGAAWQLLIAMLRRTHERTGGQGKFLMGPVQEDRPGWSDLLRSRQQCRVTEFPTSLISFSYRPGARCDREQEKR